MPRYRLYPVAAQRAILREHCAHARFVWNLAVEQQSWWRPGRKSAPGWAEQSRQLTAARAEFVWLAAGPVSVQQQALRDFAQAMQFYFNGTHRRPAWRKQGIHEGFRIVGQRGQAWDVRRLNRRWGAVRVPKVGWVRFRWSRAVPESAKSYRVTMDRSGRWHVSFAVIPEPLVGPSTGKIVGIDRGVAVTLALSNGTAYQVPVPRSVACLQRKLCRAKRGSNRRKQVRERLMRLHARNTDARKDWAEKTSTEIARCYDVIRIEDLRVGNMTRSARGTIEHPGRKVRQKAGLNRAILASGWGLFGRRLEQKAPGRIEKVKPHFTSQCCSVCGYVDAKSRKSQADFVCTACGYACNADVNAAKNIAAGHAVTARGGLPLGELANREPLASAALHRPESPAGEEANGTHAEPDPAREEQR